MLQFISLLVMCIWMNNFAKFSEPIDNPTLSALVISIPGEVVTIPCPTPDTLTGSHTYTTGAESQISTLPLASFPALVQNVPDS